MKSSRQPSAVSRQPKNNCACPSCRGVITADPEYGFDLSLVPEVSCLMCHKPIGYHKFELITMLARFGSMFFAHADCKEAA